MRARITIIVGAVLLLLAAYPAAAGTASVKLSVSVQVVPNCRIVSTDLAFGAYDPLVQHATKPLDGTANLQVLCTKSLRATVLMADNGNGSHLMHSASESLSYGIFIDAGRTNLWGTGANAVQIIGTGSTAQDVTVFGRIPPGQVVPAGWYTDAVTATVDF